MSRAALALCGALLAAGAAAQDAPAPEDSAPDRVLVEGQRVRNAAGRQTLAREDLSTVPGTSGDPMKAVQSLPGVAAVNDASGQPAVRGSRPSDNLYYADFLPVGYLFHLGGFASVFHPDLIQRFDLASAAWSPEYGDVVGAIFDISLRDPRAERLAGKLDFSLLGASVLFEGTPAEGLKFFAAGRRSWFDLVARKGEDREEGVSYTMPVYTDTQMRLLWDLSPGQRLRLDFGTAADRLAFTLAPDAKAAERDPVLVGDSNLRQSFRNAALTWEAGGGPAWTNRLALGRMVDRQFFRLGEAGQVDARASTTYLREQLQLNLAKHYALTLGGSFNRRLIDLDLDLRDARCTEFDPDCDLSSAPVVQSQQRTRQDLSDAYLNQRWGLLPDWTLTGGVRWGHDGYLHRSYTEPRLGLEWVPRADWLVSLGWGRHNQPPPPEQALRDIGNPNLEHLRSTHRVLGLAQTLGEGWSWRLELYEKSFNGYAIADPQLNYVNGASGSARGAELLLKKEGGRLEGFFALSVARAQRRNDQTGERFPFEYDQPVIATTVGRWRFNERWQMGARWSFHTGAPYTPVVGTGTWPDGRVRPIYGEINSQRVPPYHRLDLRVDARFTPAFSGYAELINAYARKNVSGYSYSADYQTREPVYQMPLLPSVGLEYRF